MEDEIKSFWPSQQQSRAPTDRNSHQEYSPPLKSARFQSTPSSIEKYNDDSSVPLTQRTAVGDKLRVLQTDNYQFMQEPAEPVVKRSAEKFVMVNEDDRPIRPAKSAIATQERLLEKADPMPAVDLEDIPIKPSKAAIIVTEGQEEIPAPIYNFEQMIEQALLQGGAPAPAAMKARKRPQISKNVDEQGSDEDTESKASKQKSKENLKKRQKYDPRKAIQEAKKAEVKEAKSAFPEGLLNKQSADTSIKSKHDDTTMEAPRRKPVIEHEEESKLGLDLEAPQQAITQGQAKSFLKRKSKNPVMQSKVTWKVESRIDCWVKDRSSSKAARNTARSPRDGGLRLKQGVQP